MADVGLDADLVLDVRSALEQARRVERALDRATTGVQVRVTADTSQLTGQVAGAVDAADTTVTVTGEAADLTGDVTAAIDAADTTALITGDASQLTGEVTTAVDEGDATVIVTGDASALTGAVTSAVDAGDTDVQIHADSTELRGASDAADNLNASLIASSRSGLQLRSILATGFAAAAIGGMIGLVGAASDLEQAIGGTTAIFGEFSGSVEAFARGAADSTGLTEEAARTLTSQIGGLLQGFQFTQEEAAQTSIVLAQLGADLAATFGGSPEDAVRALGGALRGEFDPLERFGVSLNITQANLRAVELGLADSTSNVSLNARAQASLSLIMERSAQAQGQFAREVNTTAGQLERTRAELGNTAAAVGTTLQPVINELLAAVRADLIPALADMGTALGPSLVKIVSSLLPAFGTFTDLVVALAPLVDGFAAVIGAIPSPVLAAVGSFLAFRAALGPLAGLIGPMRGLLSGLGNVLFGQVVGGMNAAGGATLGFRGGLGGLASAINPVTAALGVAAIGFTVYSSKQAENRAAAAELAAQQDKLGEALQGVDGAVDGAVDQLTQMAKAGDDVVVSMGRLDNLDVDLTAALRKAGLTAQEFGEALADTGQPLDAIIDKLSEGDNAAGATAAALSTLAEGYQDAAKAALEAGVTTEAYTQKQVDSAIAATQNADGTTNYVGALDQVQSAAAEAAAAEEEQTQALTDQQKAMAELAVTAPGLALALAGISQEGTRNTEVLGAFALAADQAGLSGAALDAVVAQLGATSGPALTAAIEAVAATINQVRDAGLNTLPTLEDVAGAVDAFSLGGFRNELEDAFDAIVGFNDNLGLIARDGGPRLAAAAAQLGPEFAAKIAQGIRDGNPAVVAEAELLLAGIEQAGVDTESLLTGTIGPNLAIATGQMGALATEAFTGEFRLDASGQLVAVQEQIGAAGPEVGVLAGAMAAAGTEAFHGLFTPDAQPGVADAQAGITGGTPGVGAAGAGMGAAGTEGFEGEFDPDPRPAVAQARALVDAGAGLMRKAGETLGRQTVEGFRSGLRPMSGQASAATSQALASVRGLSAAASSSGFGVGASLALGMAAGINSRASAVAGAAVALVNAAVSSAEAAAQVGSPSRLFAVLGDQLAQGAALGITRSTHLVEAASAGLIDAAVPQVPPVSVNLSGGAQAATGAPIGGVLVQVAPGAIVINGSGNPEVDGRRAGTALLDTVRQRQRDVLFTARAG